MYSETMGVKFTKDKPALYSLNPAVYEKAIAWVKWKADESIGVNITKCLFDMYAERWFFYEGDHLIIILPHATMDKLWEICRTKVTVDVDADATLQGMKEWVDNAKAADYSDGA